MTDRPSFDFQRHRNVAIAGGVVALHVAALWALQTGLLRRAVEVVVPVEVLSQIIPPEPKVEAPPEPPAPLSVRAAAGGRVEVELHDGWLRVPGRVRYADLPALIAALEGVSGDLAGSS